jgi:penicillin-binding protein 1A
MRALLKIIRILVYGIILPLTNFLKDQLYKFYISQKPKFTAIYWQTKWNKLKNFNWRNFNLSNYYFLFRGLFKTGLFLLLLAFVFYLAVFMGAFGEIPSKRELKAIQNNTASEVYSADGVLLGRYYIQDRTNITYDQIASDAIDALVATEDARFYDHSGIDVVSWARVLVKSILLQNTSSGGGSTLSQQLAKNLYPRKDYKMWDMPVNKLREIIIARKLEGIYSKKELLELYLNTVPMGGNLYGIERSSRRFFNKTAAELKTEEAAVLIGMLKATTTYNPRLHPEKAKQRRNVVLNQMAKYGYLSETEANSLKLLPLTLDYTLESHNDGLAPYFREQLRLELVNWASRQKKSNGEPYNLYTDGLKIYTTINSNMQLHAERAVRRRMALLQNQFNKHWGTRAPWGNDVSFLKDAIFRSDRYKKMKARGMSEDDIVAVFQEKRQMNVFTWKGVEKKTMSPLDSVRYYQRFLNTGLISVEPATGFVRAWVGGIDHNFFKYDHVRSERQVGSTFKPFVYAAALEKGITPCTYFKNERITYPEYDNWSPQNSNNQYGGEYSMRGALAHSVNTISAQLIMQTGVKRTANLAHDMGIEQDIPEVPSLALGTASLSLFEMVKAYATFANRGFTVTPVYIEKISDQEGKILREHHDKPGRKVLSTQTSAIMLNLMQGVIEEGSASRLRSEFNLRMDIAGKTGTSQLHADGWFIGITPDLVTGVWVGAESPKVRFRTLALGQGSSTALPVWGDFMRRVSQDKEFTSYRNNHFATLTPELQAQLACSSFRAEPPPKDFFDKVYDSVRDKTVETFKNWKESMKRRREERKAERKKNKRKN